MDYFYSNLYPERTKKNKKQMRVKNATMIKKKFLKKSPKLKIGYMFILKKPKKQPIKLNFEKAVITGGYMFY